jgi:flagellar basal-body rod modification protein FlgD
MITQLKNQDPFKPLDPSQYVGQLAQFSSVSGLRR